MNRYYDALIAWAAANNDGGENVWASAFEERANGR